MGIGWRKNRPGKLVVDWRDANRVRHCREFADSKEGELEAHEFHAKVKRLAKAGKIVPDERTSFQDYFQSWMKSTRYGLADNTVRAREAAFGCHLLPMFGRIPMVRVGRAAVRQRLAEMLEQGYAPSTVHQVLLHVGSMFSYAADVGDLESNPVTGLARKMRLGADAVEELPRSFSRDELGQFLAAAREGAHYHVFALLAFSGVRISEARGLQVPDLAMGDGLLHVHHQLHDTGEYERLKSRFSVRHVEIPASLCGLFRERASLPRNGPWLLVPWWSGKVAPAQSQRWYQDVLGAMKAALALASLPSHHSPHSLRHAFARLHLEAGKELLWVSRQMGHSSIKITADRYGRFARLRGEGAADALAASVEGQTLRAKVVPIG